MLTGSIPDTSAREAGGTAGLVPRSRRPLTSRGQLDAALEDLIVALEGAAPVRPSHLTTPPSP
ncbi:MAG TPA: hypothetical protein VHU92_25960 [Streptosporangiaceae bacterium]|nr:hypothetical protein [Streptosporangiaceae bacterium]